MVAQYIARCFLDAALDEDGEERAPGEVEAECVELLQELYPEFAQREASPAPSAPLRRACCLNT